MGGEPAIVAGRAPGHHESARVGPPSTAGLAFGKGRSTGLRIATGFPSYRSSSRIISRLETAFLPDRPVVDGGPWTAIPSRRVDDFGPTVGDPVPAGC